MAQVRVKRGRVDYVLELTNISRSGAMVHLGSLKEPTWVAKNRAVELGVINPEDLETVALSGRVVRILSDEAGSSFAVEFDALDGDAKEGLERLMDLAQRTQSDSPPESAEATAPAKKGPPPLPK